MATATSRIYLGIRKALTATILLLQILSLVSLVQCYRGDISRGRQSPQLVRGLVVVAREENPSSPPITSRRRKRRDPGTGEGIALRVEIRSAAECNAKGLVICGDMCVEKCCNVAKGWPCPANSSCMVSGELEYCCGKGKTCLEPVNCLDLHDSNCDNNSGQLITDPRDGKVKSCCYPGYEICTTLLNLPRCIPAASRTQTNSMLVQTRSESTSAATSPENPASTTRGGGSATLIGGLVGGAIGIVIVGICVSCTARHYRQKLMEEKEAELNMWEDDDSGVIGIRGGGGSGPSSSSGSSSSSCWERWPDSGPSTPRMSSSWSKSTLSYAHSHLEKDAEIVVMELEDMSSSRGRSYTTDSGIGPNMPVLDVPLATATCRGGFKPFDWRSCQSRYLVSSAAPQAQEGPSDRKLCLPWIPLESLIPASSPILGPWSNSRRSTVAFDQRMSQRLSFMLDLPPMPPTPRLEGKEPTRMSGALGSSNGDQDLRPLSIQKPPNALLAMV